MYSRVVSNPLCNQGWLWTSHLPTSTPWTLRLQVCHHIHTPGHPPDSASGITGCATLIDWHWDFILATYIQGSVGMNALTPGVTEKDPPLKKLTFEGGQINQIICKWARVRNKLGQGQACVQFCPYAYCLMTFPSSLQNSRKEWGGEIVGQVQWASKK